MGPDHHLPGQLSSREAVPDGKTIRIHLGHGIRNGNGELCTVAR